MKPPTETSGPVHLITGAVGGHGGISRYCRELQDGLEGKVPVRSCSMRVPPLASRLTPLQHLPLGVDSNAGAGVYHFTRIMGCSLMLWRPVRPAIATVHDLGPLVWPAERSPRILDRALLRLSLLGLRRMDRIVAVSQATARSLVEHLGIRADRIRVIHEGVDHRHFRPVPDAKRVLEERFAIPHTPDVHTLLYVGSEAPRKDLGTLLQALAILLADGLPVRLVKVGAAGQPRHREAFLRQVESLGLEERVVVAGDVDEADLPLFYSAADVFVSSSRVEGFGLPALEAMACGTPVVCSVAGALPEVVGDAGLLVESHDGPGFAAAIASLLADRALHGRLAEAGLERSQAFSWERMVHETMAVYDEWLR